MQKFPLPLNSGKECSILKFFGPKLCSKLDKKLEEHKLSSSSLGRKVNNDFVVYLWSFKLTIQFFLSKISIADEGIVIGNTKRNKKVVSNQQPSTSGINNYKLTSISNEQLPETVISLVEEKLPVSN